MKKIFTFFILLASIILKAQVCQIPVIIHVIHGGQAPGTYPNLAQGQLNSQIQVLNDDYAGVGYNSSNYPVNAFTAWATNTFIAASSIDGLGRIKIANTGISFCLATKDSLGNTLAEPGIHRVDYNTLPAYAGSKNPASSSYSSFSNFINFMNSYIKPNTTWNCSKYLNIWVTDVFSASLLGNATFPPNSTLAGIFGGLGTRTTDGVWVWGKTFGNSTIFPSGTYTAPFDLGRVATHEIGHWLGLLHNNNCPTGDYCDDTPPGNGNVPVPGCSLPYPFAAGSCTVSPSNSPDGSMYMNFMDYSNDCEMYMFTQDQANRMNIARANSPYRKFLGTHGVCASCVTSVEGKKANENEFKIFPNPANDKLYFRSENAFETIIITDVFGKIVFEVENINKNDLEINTSLFSRGIYFAIAKSENETGVKKFVKE